MSGIRNFIKAWLLREVKVPISVVADLATAMDENKDGSISLGELVEFVRTRVKR